MPVPEEPTRNPLIPTTHQHTGLVSLLQKKQGAASMPHGIRNRVRFDSTLRFQNARSTNPGLIVRRTASDFNTAARLKTLSQPNGNDKVENQALTGGDPTSASWTALSSQPYGNDSEIATHKLTSGDPTSASWTALSSQPYGNDSEIATHKLTSGDPTSASWNARGQPNGNDSVNATHALTEKPQLIPPFPGITLEPWLREQLDASELKSHTRGTISEGSASTASAESRLSSQSSPPRLMRDSYPNDQSPTSVQEQWPPSDRELMAAVKQALKWTPRQRTAPIFDFAITTAAAENNLAILEAADFDLQMLLLSNGLSPLQPGSEFRPVSLLAPIFQHHPFWSHMRSTLMVGASLESIPLSEPDRLKLLDEALLYGNHKSAMLNGPMLMKMLDKEAEKGWHIPLPVNSLTRIPGVIVAPLGLVEQSSIDENNKTTVKWRLTHDQSFQFGIDSIKSVNQRIPDSSLTACNYGFALRRLAHMIVSLRNKFPDTPILISKLDVKSAYRRMHLHGSSAIQCVVTTTPGLDPNQHPIALVALRATFGGKPCPFRWSELSEPVADLANALSRCKLWDPATLLPLHHELIGEPRYSDHTRPLAQAKELRVDTEADEFGMTDVFLDDLISVFPALSADHIKRGSRAALLALEVVSRPLVERGETLPRDHMLAVDKARAEGTPAEVQIVLGWEIDTRRHTIALPATKHTAWKQSIHEVLFQAKKKRNRIRHATLERLLGRLQHTAAILTQGAHFLNRIRTAEQRAKTNGGARLCPETRADLTYWITLLDLAAAGVSLNLLVYRVPNQILRTDACEHGLGGFSLTTGRAWRWEIPLEHRNKKSVNYLKFLACIACIVLSLHEGEGAEEDCILSLGDNTSSLGWLRKSNFAADEEQASHSALARHFANLMASESRCHFSQWFAGKENDVADLLSREHEKSDALLTKHNSFVYAAQVPPDFHISPLPEAITCWLAYWVQHEQGTKESPPEPTRKQARTGKIGSSTWPTATSWTTSSSMSSTDQPNTRSSGASPNACERRPIHPRAHRKMLNWLQQHALAPSEAYLRPSARQVNLIPLWTEMEKLHSFYRDSGKDIEMKTQAHDRKKRSLSMS